MDPDLYVLPMRKETPVRGRWLVPSQQTVLVEAGQLPCWPRPSVHQLVPLGAWQCLGLRPEAGTVTAGGPRPPCVPGAVLSLTAAHRRRRLELLVTDEEPEAQLGNDESVLAEGTK